MGDTHLVGQVCFAWFGEEVDTAVGPVYVSSTVLQLPHASDSLFEVVKETVESAEVTLTSSISHGQIR